jgi:hypothetical protein
LFVESYACSNAEATIKVCRISNEVHTTGRSTPLRSTPPGDPHLWGPHPSTREVHTKALNHTRDPAPNSHLRCGAHLLLSPHLNGLRSGSLTRGREEAQEKSLARITNLRIVHNLWTLTIAIDLNTLQRLYNCTRPNRAQLVANHPKPYHTAGVQVSG